MRKRKTVRKITEDLIKIPFVVAMANKLLEAIGFVRLIDESVKWDKQQCKTSPGNHLKAVVLSTFIGTNGIRSPLSGIHKKYNEIDTEHLFGEGVLKEHLNDDAIGRALDKLYEANPENLFGTLCLSAYSEYNIEFKRLHSDTTTVSFYGEYNDDEDEENEVAENLVYAEVEEDTSLRIVRGYSKDNKPECKQVVVGKVVSEHGVPLYSKIMNGNTSDVDWNKEAVKMTAEIFGDRLSQGIYIADCKLVNKEMIKTLTDPDRPIRFISRCPANFHCKLADKHIAKAYTDNNWTDLGQYGKGKKACNYIGCEYTTTVYGRDIRVLVLQSSAGKESFEAAKTKQLSELEKAVQAVNKKIFACKSDAVKEWERFQKEHKNCLYRCSEEYIETKTEKRKRGNPGKNPKPPTIEIKWNLNIKVIGEDEERMTKLRRSKESFVLITNVMPEEYGMREILGYYKDQYIVEVNFRYYKSPNMASAIYLKNEGRINALMMLLSVSLLIRALMQYMMRKGYQENKDPLPKVGYNGAKLHPGLTFHFLSQAMEHAYFRKEGVDQYCYIMPDAKTELCILTLLKLMGISLYELIE